MALTQADVAVRARELLAGGYEIHLASNRTVLERLELESLDSLGVPVVAHDFLAASAGDWSVADLMRVYNVLNQTVFGDKGIPLQDWVMLDLGLLPSAFMLITLSATRVAAARDQALPSQARALDAALAQARRLGHHGPIPVAGYCAAPTPIPGGWVGWSLCSAVPGLGTVAKGLALLVYGARTLTGVAQFYDPALRVHRKFGRMEVLRAVLDLHPVPHTLVYRSDVFEEDDDQPAPTGWLRGGDLEAQRELQVRLDAGRRCFILSPGLVDDRVPILER
ncbi:MAG: hypothetical protein ACRDMX_08020 [Solirubrobacteraceae bacterium]